MRFRVAGTAVLAALFTFTLASAASAQNGTLSGTVTEDAGGAVNAVDISVRGGGDVFNAQTDAQGRYNLSVPAGTYTIVLTLIGHQQTSYANVRVSAGQTTTLDMTMPTLAEALTGIVVSVSKQAENRIEAAATTDVITSQEISERSTFNPADHLRSAPGVDVATTGLQNSTIVVRGFNNIFSGALNMLSDYRLAGVPSLRVNLMHFIPTTDEDIDRIEVVLGPGSALYGPNTANGVVHLISKSPLDDQGTTVTMGTGAKGTGNLSAFQGAFRTAFLVSENLGIKVSGQFLDAEEWEYIDPVEQTAKEFAAANPVVCRLDKITRGLSADEAAIACGRIGNRNFDIQRWSVEARADWRFAPDGTFIATYGRNTSSGIELTGLGAGQINDWVSDFFQGRVNKGRLFAQTYYNRSNSGNSFLLRDGVTLVDRSSLLVGQLQHGFAVSDGRQDFTYGVDYFKTDPVSSGRIYGSYEDVDGIEEWGAYVQSKTAISPQLDLIVAGRMDSHSVLPSNVFSPRAALVFKPNENHGIRATYNQAFSTPSALNLFLDIGGGFAPPPIGSLGYTTRAYGSGPDGWSLRGPDGTFEWMRSPFTPPGSGGPSQLVPAQTPLMWQYYVGVLAASGQIDPGTAAFLASLTPGNSDIGRLALDPNSGAVTPIGSLDIPDLASTLQSNTETFELGWTGVLNNRISISADVYYTTKNDFVSPLVLETPLFLLNPTDIEAYLTPILGPGPAAALAVQIPVGVLSSEEVGAQGADLIVSYRNVGDINLWGGDISFQAFLTDQWILTGTYSHVSDDTFEITGGSPIALNAPSKKGSAGLAYRDPSIGLNLSTRIRFTSAFPATSAGFVGDVDSATLVDLTAGYAIPRSRAELQLSVSNLFDSAYRSFVGVPEIGRFTMIRVKYDLF